MQATDSVTTWCVTRSMTPDLPDVVEALGSERFCPQLLGYLNKLCGADHCAVFQLGNDSLNQIAVSSLDGTNIARQQTNLYLGQQYWRKDPAMQTAQRHVHTDDPIVIKVDTVNLVDHDLRTIVYPMVRGRLIIAGRRQQSAYGLSILRAYDHGLFTDDDIGRMGTVADLLVALLAKHADSVTEQRDSSVAMSSLPEIERCIDNSRCLPRRELEVCARALYGLSTAGIAVDLGIGEATVKTYRRRAYQRLNIGTQRELLNWYLALWNARPSATLGRFTGRQALTLN